MSNNVLLARKKNVSQFELVNKKRGIGQSDEFVFFLPFASGGEPDIQLVSDRHDSLDKHLLVVMITKWT